MSDARPVRRLDWTNGPKGTRWVPHPTLDPGSMAHSLRSMLHVSQSNRGRHHVWRGSQSSQNGRPRWCSLARVDAVCTADPGSAGAGTVLHMVPTPAVLCHTRYLSQWYCDTLSTCSGHFRINTAHGTPSN